MSERAAGRLVWGCFTAGLLLSALMVARSQVGGDQLNLLARGWLLEARGQFISFGNPMSTGGRSPGGITSLLTGLPLLVWPDHRAPTLVVLLFHVLAFVILDRAVRPLLAAHERLLLAVFYWLGPWRLYYSGFLWNPNYLYLFGALHLATALDQRRRAGFWASFLHFAGLLVALQIHASALLLVAASALLWWRGYFKLHRAGALAGLLAASLPLVPWLRDVLRNPALLAEVHKGFLGRGLIHSLPRGALYWLRYPALSLAGRMATFDFTEAFGSAADLRLFWPSWALTQVVGWASIALPLLANLWLWRRWRRRALRRLPEDAPGRAWLRGYALVTATAAAVVLALSPTTFMYWQGLILFHAAVLPVVFWLGALARAPRRPSPEQPAGLCSEAPPRRLTRPVAIGVAVYAGCAVLIGLGMSFGSPDYRCRGDETVVFPLRSDSPMFRDLGIQRTCPWPLDVPQGWWPDVLPEEPSAAVAARDASVAR
jgi:hypothetical protein